MKRKLKAGTASGSMRRQRRVCETSLFDDGFDLFECSAFVGVIVVLAFEVLVFQKQLPFAFQLFLRRIVRVLYPAHPAFILVRLIYSWRGAATYLWCETTASWRPWCALGGLDAEGASTELAVALQNTANVASLRKRAPSYSICLQARPCFVDAGTYTDAGAGIENMRATSTSPYLP